MAVTDAPEGSRVLALAGPLNAYSIHGVWPAARSAVKSANGRSVIVDASAVEYCDGAGIALLVDLMRMPQLAHTGAVEVRNLAPRFQDLLEQFDPSALVEDHDPPPRRRGAVEEIGLHAARIGRDMREQVVFVGATFAALMNAVRHPTRVRWRDVWPICEHVGADALPIVALIAFLMGVIIAFQSAVPMKRFGAEIFVADLIGLSMLRELAPLMTAILLAGRSGAAFAAEIGTMQVNQEIDALTTMGLDPVRFLVVTRVIAALLMTPILTLFADLVGLLGGALTMLSFGIPYVTFVHEIEGIVDFSDFLAGFVKSFVFALLIAGIGCLRGLQTTTGASAVGNAATRAVVSGIILLVIVDGVFAVMYFVLDI
ncbi:MAG: MlaE family lipid ABC transporter permease subunit [Pseudomonadota bacterium]|nr:MlaE family lipid ABC transporter permease subunit [Pseudomonadota bacterium]